MSYILDALKKAEAEQDPDLRTSLAVEQHKQRRSRFGQYLIVAALLGNLLVLVWLFGPLSPRSTDPNPADEVAPAAVDEQPAAVEKQSAAVDKQAAAVDKRPAAANKQPVASNTQPDAAEAPNSQVGTTPAPTKLAAKVHTNLAGLSAAARRRFPELSFSTHLYANDASMRAVVVNGERLSEGDRLGNLVLTNITETGVVFSFENYLVTVSVLDDWD
jgi:general secretion pathway protein B